MKQVEKFLEHKLPEDEIQRKLDGVEFLVEYRKRHILIFFSLIFAILGQIIFYVIVKDFKPPNVNIVGDDGATRAFSPLKYPNISIGSVQLWAQESVQKVYNFNFLQYEKQLVSARYYFTKEGWNAYLDFFLKSSFLESIKKNRLSVAATPIAKPIVKTRKRSADGTMSWDVIVPIVVTFTGDTPQKSQYFHVNVVIVQTPTVENPKALGVQSMIAHPVEKP